MKSDSQTATPGEGREDVATLVSALDERDAQIASLKDENARLWRSYNQLKEELALLKRRIFVAKAERIDTTSMQLELADLVMQLDALADMPKPDDGDMQTRRGKDKGARERAKPTGRRRLEDVDLPEVPIEIADALFEALVSEGKAERMGFETSYKLGRERGGLRRIAIKRVKYRAVNAQGETEIETAAVPTEIIPRCMASASTLAFIATSKYCDGLPLYRIEQIFDREGFPLDRGSMSRWLEQMGATFGATVVEAMRKDALANAFCIMTDATGFAIQPGVAEDGKRRPCRKGHYFVQIADRDHILFDFTPKETSAVVRAMFRGFDGYIQADAKSVYDVLYKPPNADDPDDDGCTRIEVGCWAHARRRFWEAALGKHAGAREALVRLTKIFATDATIRGGPPAAVKAARHRHLAPLVHELLDFAAAEYEKVKHQRGAMRSAFGYCVRQRVALTAFLDDGRLRLDNNLSEAALRKVVIIRDSALFAGSDDHAASAGHILSLIASARLHCIEPEGYLRDLVRVLPFWPRERYLELAPKHWARTRVRIDECALAREVGVIDVPDADA